MKKLQGSKSKICPGSPDHSVILNSLPKEVSEVASTLLPEDLEILAYLIACPSQTRASTHHSCKSSKKVQCEVSCSKQPPSSSRSVSLHSYDDPCSRSSSPNVELQLRKPAALFGCNCFQCYTSYWSRWDASPNQGKIDEAIALYEDHIDKKSKKPTKAEKRKEGKGRGRRSYKEPKHKEVKTPPAKVEKEKAISSQRATIADAVAAVSPKDHSPEPSLVIGKEIRDKQKQHQLLEEEEVVNQQKSMTADLEAEAVNAVGSSQSERSASSPKSPGNHGKNSQASKEKMAMKESSKVRTSRVAPFIREGDIDDQSDNSGLDSSDLDSDEDDSTTLHRGRRLVTFVANRLWGFWDRRVQTKVVDVY